MNQAEKLIWTAENQLTEYSTEACKIEKLRRQFSLIVPYPEQKAIRKEIEVEIPTNVLAKLVEEHRQTIALPFWGIGGLGLLFGISFQEPLNFLATTIGFYMAFQVQQWGWELQAKRLVIKTLDEIEARFQASKQETMAK